MRRILIGIALALALAVVHIDRGRAQDPPPAMRAADAPADALWLDSLDLSRMVQRRGTPRAGRSGSGRGANPPPLSLGGVVYPRGIGTL